MYCKMQYKILQERNDKHHWGDGVVAQGAPNHIPTPTYYSLMTVFVPQKSSSLWLFAVLEGNY